MIKIEEITIDEITKEKFESYEQVRQSGITNMFNVSLVCNLTDLTRNECLYIMHNYEQLSNIFKEVSKKRYPNKIGLVNFNKFDKTKD